MTSRYTDACEQRVLSLSCHLDEQHSPTQPLLHQIHQWMRSFLPRSILFLTVSPCLTDTMQHTTLIGGIHSAKSTTCMPLVPSMNGIQCMECVCESISDAFIETASQLISQSGRIARLKILPHQY
ncbi:hypothetical protein ECG_08088 [Echinococcus granulosus]|nr:hypothetical protein ECG_08091 [Echinococcus granulosus]KAH9279118.1 hypothetical protein ECG_08088 [Echinococcus granulosus]